MTTRDVQHEDETLAVALARLGPRVLDASELEWLLGIVLQVCDATASARAHGLLHRDPEPRNVMVRDGHVHLFDGGVALGTPAYMAPEQAWGRARDLDARTDVYGIGGILYAILTRSPPHHGASAAIDLASARSGTVCAPQQACPERSLPPGLCRIASRALSANPSERHPSVEILKQDIQRFMSARPQQQEAAV
jgi:serine/threonine-protein kinase